MTKKDLVVRFDGEKTEVKSVNCSCAGEGGGGVGAEGSRKAEGCAPSAAAAAAPALPLSPNDNPAYGSPLRAAEVSGSGGAANSSRGELWREEADRAAKQGHGKALAYHM